MGPNTVELDYRFCLLFSFCGYLKMNLSGSFAFSAVLLSLLVPDIFFLWWIAVDPPQFTSSQFPACSSISLYLLKFLYGPIFLWQNIDPCCPLSSHSCLPPADTSSTFCSQPTVAPNIESVYLRGGLFFPVIWPLLYLLALQGIQVERS